MKKELTIEEAIKQYLIDNLSIKVVPSETGNWDDDIWEVKLMIDGEEISSATLR